MVETGSTQRPRFGEIPSCGDGVAEAEAKAEAALSRRRLLFFGFGKYGPDDLGREEGEDRARRT